MNAASASAAYSPSLKGQQLQPHKRAASANGSGQMAATAHKAHAAAAQTCSPQTVPTSHPQMHSGLPILQAVHSGGAAAAAPQQSYVSYQSTPASADALLIYNTALLLTAMPAVQANVTVRLSNGRLLTIIIDPPTQQS